MKTYEITVGVFHDSHTTGNVQHWTIEASDLTAALHQCGITAGKMTSSGQRNEIIRVQRIN